MAVQRGEVYFVNLNPVQGREQAGRRPVLVLSVDAINRLPLVVTVVVGTKGESVTRDYPTNVRVSSAESGLPIETVFSVSNCVRWIPAALRVPLQADCRGPSYRRSKPPFATVSDCECPAGALAEGFGPRDARNSYHPRCHYFISVAPHPICANSEARAAQGRWFPRWRGQPASLLCSLLCSRRRGIASRPDGR